jgi:hypothetical protein
MAMTIRNKETEAMIRRIGKKRGEGPSSVIRRLAEQELRRNGEVPQAEYNRRMRAFEELARRYPPPEPRVPWSEIEAEMQSLFDYLDEDDASEREDAGA